jgi:hypothetical protein
MERRMIRGVVTNRVGCHEKTDWFPEGSAQAIEALKLLVRKQTGPCSVSWERWGDEADLAGPHQNYPCTKPPFR